MSKLNLDLSGVNGELSTFQLVPNGIYDVKVIDVELKETKAKDGGYLSIKLQVVGGEHSGKVIGENINIFNKNEKAQEIGRRKLKQMLIQIGHPNPDFLADASEILNGIFRCEIEMESYQTESGAMANASRLARIVSKDIALKNGTDESQKTRQDRTPKEKIQPKLPPVIKEKTPTEKLADEAPPVNNKPAWMQ